MASLGGALEMSRQPLPTARMEPSLGLFSTSSLTIMHDEPPPSRFTALLAPIPWKMPHASMSVTPTEVVLRPSMTTK